MPKRIRIRSEFLSVQRRYWCLAHNLLTALGRAYDARAAGDAMRLNLDSEQAEMLRQVLPAGAVVEHA